MANQKQNPPQQEQLFVAAKQVGFNLEDIILNTNNEVNTFRNAIGVHYLPHFREYVAPPSIDIVRPWFEKIGYGEAVPAKGTLKKSLLPPRHHHQTEQEHREKVVPYTRFLSLLMMHKIKEGYGDGELTLYPTQVFSVNN
ncbi:hypothetical protein Tco_1415410 [Tanacetum coccineum]